MRVAWGIAFLLAVAGAANADTDSAKATPDPGTITVLLVGDTAANGSGRRLDSKGLADTGQSWAELTAGIEPLIDADLNFMNVETVVTDDGKLVADSKGQKKPYSFRSHPEGIRHLVKIGFNLASLANNHSFDYGVAGVKDTLRFMDTMYEDGLAAYAGVGLDRESAAKTKLVDVRGTKVGFAALGIVTNNLRRHRARPGKPGSVAYRFDDDWKLVTGGLADSAADFRILSIHYGRERFVRADKRQLEEWRWAARERKVDLVVGHHAHVARGVERNGTSFIFYGLGNFLHPGTRNMGGVGRFKLCRDFGLLARVHAKRNAAGRMESRAVELVPLRNTHRKVRPYAAAEGRRRIEVMNYHARQLDNTKAGAEGVRFMARADGSGLYCVPGAEEDGGRIGAMCGGFRAPVALSAVQVREIGRACAEAKANKPKK